MFVLVIWICPNDPEIRKWRNARKCLARNCENARRTMVSNNTIEAVKTWFVRCFWFDRNQSKAPHRTFRKTGPGRSRTETNLNRTRWGKCRRIHSWHTHDGTHDGIRCNLGVVAGFAGTGEQEAVCVWLWCCQAAVISKSKQQQGAARNVSCIACQRLFPLWTPCSVGLIYATTDEFVTNNSDMLELLALEVWIYFI